MLELFQLGFQGGHLLLQPGCSGCSDFSRLAIGCFHLREIALDTVIDFLRPLFQFATREVAVMGVHSIELAAINGDDSMREQIQLPAQHDKLSTYIPYAGAVVSLKVGNRFEVG